MSTGGKLQWLEAMRALAALWVVLSHTKLSVTSFVGPLEGVPQFFANGHLGVDFFFVLSGFIIAFSTERLLQTGRGWREYVSARAIRIYVPYLPIGIAMLLAYRLIPGLSEGGRDTGLVTSLLLLPTPNPPALSVAWSLVHEIIFYAVFSLVFVSRKLLIAVVLFWACFIAAWAHFEGDVVPGWWYLANPVNLCFFLGAGMFHATRNGVSNAVGAVCALLGILAVTSQAGLAEPNRWLLTLGFGALIIAAQSSAAQRISPGRWFLFLGAASYSIYLVHNPALSILARIIRGGLPGTAPAVAFVIMVACAVAAALAYYVAYERPVLGKARQRVSDYLKQRSGDGMAPS